jgi:hypothetical protein
LEREREREREREKEKDTHMHTVIQKVSPGKFLRRAELLLREEGVLQERNTENDLTRLE